jgi:glutamyl-tRNA reductase
MSVLALGVTHQRADLALLERLAVPADEHRKVLNELVALEHVLEAVVVSTCNRVEVYVHVSRFHPGLDEVSDWFADRAGDRRDEVADVLDVTFDETAAAHLFSVAAGIESMVVGERQIALQVKQAMEEARDEGTARRMLQRLFRQAVAASRRVRRETTIGAGASSMVDIGLDLVVEELGGSLRDHPALIVGAGKIGSLTADRMCGDVDDLLVWNRSNDKAERLSARFGGRVIHDLADGLRHVDIVVCTTGAPQPVITADLVNGDRAARPLVILDLAMPHNVDPACADLPGVSVYGIADVRDLAQRRPSTAEAVQAARQIVAQEAARFSGWINAIEVEPTIRALRQRADDVRVAEIDRLARRLSSLDDDQRDAVEALTRGIVNTFLHQPTVRLKELADASGADVAAEVLRQLFDLDDALDDRGDDGEATPAS